MSIVHSPFADYTEDKLQGWDYIPLKANEISVAPFNSEILPTAFKDYVDDVSYRMQAPPDYVAVGLMVAFSAVIGRKILVQPKQSDDWTVTPNLWGGIIGRPSAMKSPTLSEALKPIDRMEAARKNKYQQEKIDYEIQSEVQKLLIKEAKDQAKKAISEGDTDKATKLISDATAASNNQPIRSRLKTSDATVEKLGVLLQENPNGILTVRDELAGLLKSLSKEEKAGDRAFYLEGWNGNSSFTFDRIGRGTIDIEAITLSVIGGIQPSKLKPIVLEAINGGAGDDGLLQRFQLLVYPDLTKKWNYVDKQPNKAALEKVFLAFNAADKIDVNTQIKLKFNKQAQDYFVQWLTELEGKLRGDIHPAIESHLAKYRSLIPSLALLIHIADNQETYNKPITEVATLRALEWADYLESHAMKIYGMGLNAEVDNAKLIVNRFDKLGTEFSKRDIQRRNWKGLNNNKDIQNALDVLVNHGYLKEIEESPNGRVSIRYLVNPRVQ